MRVDGIAAGIGAPATPPAEPSITPGQRLAALEPASHQPHALHGERCDWTEKNCYVDVWIELVHVLGLQPLAMLGSALTLDFIGDQWTFFKPCHADLRALYGLEVQELTVWRPLADHLSEHLTAGRLLSLEADAWWLPDTAATDYRRQHTKTTILVLRDEPVHDRMVYLHNAGLHAVQGEDRRQLLANGGLMLPLFAEWIDVSRCRSRDEPILRGLAAARLREHLDWRPTGDPVRRFEARFVADLAQLQSATDRAVALEAYHRWSFAATRQFGIGMELLAAHLRWLQAEDEAADAFARCSQSAKALILKGARAVASGRALDAGALFDTMADSWALGMARLADTA